jgi:rubrerythrin
MNFGSFNEILEFAIEREEEARQFYLDLAAKMARPHMRSVFEDFAREELGHKMKLTAIREGKLEKPRITKILNLKISDYLVEVEPAATMDYQQALVLAMKREKAAFRLYTDLAARIEDEKHRGAFLMLAQEEARHKLRFELEYDEMMTEN